MFIGPRGLSKSFRFGYGPPEGPLSVTSRQWWVWVRFCVPEDFFYPFINAESTVSTFNNTIELKVYIHECIFWGCSVDTFWEDNLAIFDHKIYASLMKYRGCIKGVRRDTPSPPVFDKFPTLLRAAVIITSCRCI
jgi:hypothetical protein